ncbi:hypothetical protein Vretimale_8949 [Volvox reticuliferus]|uniref:Probable ubiquitin carboxyl-terminal hydrolase MINDY-4 n=1 Tax=Volvox reticuliferus TaxID=1737510 RepID=A0A8J4CSJ5_9CHLO|nr:hypothetical protein Vretifemale_14407 [Volvox reticuliferus]GIM04362.1 hypothetical protein Vretimale_8949 [Volvox reticuliferus]
MSYQSTDIVEALVREYLVRAGCTSALEGFNREKPKHGNSITKREVLRKSLGLDKAAAYYKKQNPTADGLPSTLEVWVIHQMAKLGASPDAGGSALLPAPRPAPGPVRPIPRAATEPDEVSAPVAAPGFPRRPSAGSGVAPAASLSSAASATASQGHPVRPAPLRQGFGFGEAVAPRQAAPTTAMRISSTPSVENDSDGEPEIIHSGTARGSAGGVVRVSPQGSMHHSASASNVSLRASAPGLGLAVGSASQARSSSGVATAVSGSFTPPRAHVANRPDGGRPGVGISRHRGEMVMEDVGDINFDDEDAGAAATGVATMRISGPATRKPGTAISPDVMRQVKQLLWGAQGQPPPSWKQGFFFNRHSGLQFGLLQKQGGPCGVLAAVQALILAALHSPTTGFNTTPRVPEQQSALASAITESLWQARMGPTAALVLPEGEAGGAAGRLGYEQLCRAVTQHTASSKEALLDLVRSSLSVLMSEDGWGVVLLVMSLVLSRGVDNVRADMDEPNNSLMGMHGYCTQELVNMIVLGVANSNVFDGNKHLDGSTVLKGISRRCRVGLLTLFEWYKYVEVGPSLKNPTLPVWVICSESHFTVLFAQDARALQNQLPFDLYYYDELANQESIIKLSITKDPRGGWTARVGSSFSDRGKCEGQNIPPLECVIETRWPGVKVNWNGHEAIL